MVGSETEMVFEAVRSHVIAVAEGSAPKDMVNIRFPDAFGGIVLFQTTPKLVRCTRCGIVCNLLDGAWSDEAAAFVHAHVQCRG